MKSIWLVRGFYFSLVAAILAVFPVESRAATTYPLTCRGGEGIQLNMNHNTGSGAQFGQPVTSNVNNNLVVSFLKAAVASSGGLKPGECAWSDRPMRSNEPSRMCITDVSVEIIMETNQDGSFSTFTIINNRNNTNAIKAIEGLLYPSQYQTFWVYNDGLGCLRF